MTHTQQLPSTVLLTLLATALGSSANAASLAEDFNNSTNPGSGWTHGFNDIGSGGGNDIANDIAFGLLNSGGNPGDRWTGDGTTNTNYPPNDLMLVNLGNGGTAGDHWGGGSITWDSGVSYHTWGDSNLAGGINGLSGDDTIFSTYTIPVDGTYDISGVWTENGNSGGADVEILVNGLSIGAGAIDLDIAGDSTTLQSLAQPLTMGDTVSFRTTRQTDYTPGGSARLDAAVIPLLPITLEVFVDRQTGVVTLRNGTAADVEIIGYSIESASGALDPSGWTSFADSNASWHLFEATDTELSEATLGSETLSTPSTLDLGNVWRRGPDAEDVRVTVALANDTVTTLPVEFTGLELNVGDLDFDGDVDTADWAKFRQGQGVDMTGMNTFETYELGDLDGDLDNDTDDFRLFKNIFASQVSTAASGGTSVPEPAGVLLLAFLAVGGVGSLRTAARQRLVTVIALGSACLLTATTASAFTLAEDFDVSGNPGNGWTHGFNDTSVGGGNDIANDVPFALFHPNNEGNAGDRWTGDGTGNTDYPPNDLMLANLGSGNTEGNHWGGGEITWEAGASYHTWGNLQSGGINGLSGDDTIFSTFTVPVAGTYDIVGAWTENGNSGGAAVDILVNGLSIGSGLIDLDVPGDSATIQSLAQSLSMGDTVSFRTTRQTDYTQGGSARLDASVVNIIPQTLTLQVDVNSGLMQIANLSGNPITLDTFQITSASNAGTLDPAGFNGVGDDLAAFPAGDGSGNGWEISEGNNANALTESYLTGDSTLQAGEVLPLGAAYDKTVDAQDLAFMIGRPGAPTLVGLVDYNFVGVGVPGDFSGDGVVDAADYTVWRDNEGSNTPLPNDGGLGTPISGAHYTLWKQNYGNSVGSALANAAAVPEPSAWLLLSFCWTLLAGGRRPPLAAQRVLQGAARTPRLRRVPVTATSVGLVVLAGACSPALATVTLDRLYLFGDDTTLGLEGASNGAVIGSINTSPLPPGDTLDSQGPTGARLQLSQVGGPTYVNVGPSGLARPGAASNTYGVQFDGTSQHLQGIRLNRPDELASLVFAANGSNYPLNYTGITTRGLQMWVYPEQAGIDSGNYQSVVFDSFGSGGPAINNDGKWTQSSSGRTEGGSGVPVADEAPAVVGNQWHHVMQHIVDTQNPALSTVAPGTGAVRRFTSIVYVNGVAVSATNDDINLGGSTDYPGGRLVVGAAEVPFDQVTPDYGLYFDGAVDDLEMYVYGDNSSLGGQNYGAFNLFADNEWIAETIANDPFLQGTLLAGDINRDGIVNGNGLGPASSDDVSAFIDGWGYENRFQGARNVVTAGDWNTWGKGDLNLDGVVDFHDWFILRANHGSPASLNLQALLSVPEPTAATVLALGLVGASLCRRTIRDV